jgi:hypothetical protein
MLQNKLFGMVISFMFLCGTLVSSCTGAISPTCRPYNTHRRSCFQHLHTPFIHIFVTFWEVSAIDLQPRLCPWKWQSFSGSDLKKKTDMPKWGSGMSEEVPQYNVCHFVVTQAVTSALCIVLQEKWYFVSRILGNLRVPIDGQFFYNSLMTVASLGINYMV